MNPTEIAEVVGASFLALVVLTVIIGLVWWIETTFYWPALGASNYRRVMVKMSLENFFAAFLYSILYLPLLLAYALGQVVLNVFQNVWKIFFLFLLASALFAWLEYQDQIVANWIIGRQCVIMPFTNLFVFPLLNAVRMLFNAGIILWDYFVDLRAFYEYGPAIIFLKCTAATTDASNLFAYFANVIFSFVNDTIAWFVIGFLDHDYDILNTLDAIGLFLDSLVPPLVCFCKDLAFLWQALSIWFRLASLHMAINCILNFFVRLFQIPINTVMMFPAIQPQFNYTALAGCCAVKSSGDFVEDTVFLIAQTGWGVFSGQATLPSPVDEFLSTHWTGILTGPLCSVFLFANLTLTAGVNYNNLAAVDGTGISYLQFGFILDQWKVAAYAFGSLFILFNNDAVAFVTESLLALVSLVAFLFEWILGNVFYWLFGGPLPNYPSAPYGSFSNFLKYKFPDYWLLPSLPGLTTAFASAFASAFQATQALGNLFANLLNMDPLGGIVQHSLNIILCLLQVLFNLISFIYTIVTFESDIRTTMRAVNFTPLFNEMYFLAGSLGEMIRQFANPDCAVLTNEANRQVFCCLGNLVEQLLDIFVIIAQQWTYFLQDLITLPTGTVHFCISFIGYNTSDTANCIRIPDISVAIFLIDSAICEFTCTVFSAIPFLPEFECGFPIPPPPAPGSHTPPQPAPNCGHVSTCLGDLACKFLRILVVPLIIANTFFTQYINGAAYGDFTVLGQVVAQIFFNALSNIVISWGQIIDCALCAFITSQSPNCSTAIYDIFFALAEVIRFLPLIFTRLFFIVVKLILTFVVGLFHGNPVQALIKFIVGLLIDLFGGLGKAVVDLISAVFNAVGLAPIGYFIQALYNGLCPLLQVYINLIVLELKIITLGLIPINFVNLCCYAGTNSSCVPTSKRYEDQFPVIDGVIQLTEDTLISFLLTKVSWPEDAPCNTTMRDYDGVSFRSMTEWQRGEVMFCLNSMYWQRRTDNQSVIQNSTCDVLMAEYNGTAWFSIDITTRRLMMDCMSSRFHMDAFRGATNFTWLPSDLLYSTDRKLVFLGELARGLLIYWQYARDKGVTADTFLSPVYQQNWATMNLNTSHYAGVRSPLDVVIFRSRFHLRDYFEWNQASQYDAIAAITTGAWGVAYSMLESLSNMSFSLSDQTVDPTQLVQYNYFLGEPSSGISSSFHNLFSEMFQVAVNMSAFWSNPDNLKKRSLAVEKMRDGAYGIYQAAYNQLTKAAVERELLAREEAAHWRGERSPEQTQAFLAHYHNEMHYNQRSIVYKLSHWWERNKGTLFVPHRLNNTREGDRRLVYNQSETLFQYRDAKTGKLHDETGYQRLWRFYDAVTAGSEGSRARMNGLGRVFSTVKHRLYHSAIRNNVAFAAQYIRRTYEAGWTETVSSSSPPPPPPSVIPEETSGDNAFVEQYYGVMADQDVKLVSAHHHHKDYSVNRLRAQEQALYCDTPSMRNDGLCQGYVRPQPPEDETVRYLSQMDGSAVFSVGSGVQYSVFAEARARVKPPRLPGVTTARGVIFSPNSTLNYVASSTSYRLALFTVESILDLTCLTNISFGNSTLCEQCFFLDQLLGRIETGLNWTITYFVGGQFGAAFQTGLDYQSYVTNDFAYVIVGDGPELRPGGFPNRAGFSYDLKYWGDPTPNKLRFSDIAALINGNGTGNSTHNTTLPIPLDYSSINGLVGYVITTVFGFAYNFFADILSLLTGGSADNIDAVVTYFANWWFFCDWITGDDYLGTNKRFSVGEVVFGIVVIDVIVTVTLMSTIQYNLLNIFVFTLAQLIGLGYMLSIFWVIQDNFSLLCYPGLPVNAMNDGLYYLFYTVAAKCEWFWAWAIADPTYDNLSCYSCANAGSWHVINCVRDRGFADIFSNVAFMIQKYDPSILDYIRNSPILPIALFYSIPYVNQRVNEFAGVDLSTEANYRTYVGCNYIGTLIPNLVIGAIFFYVLSSLSPLVGFFFVALGNLLLLFYRWLLVLQYMIIDVWVTAAVTPLIIAGYTDTPVPQHVEEHEALASGATTALNGGGGGVSLSRRMFATLGKQQQPLRPRPSLLNMMQRTADNLFGDRKNK